MLNFILFFKKKNVTIFKIQFKTQKINKEYESFQYLQQNKIQYFHKSTNRSTHMYTAQLQHNCAHWHTLSFLLPATK